MFEAIKNFFVENWKKLLTSLGAAFVSFLLLKFILAPLFSLTFACTLAALGVGYLVFTKVALWEIEKVVDKAKDIVK